jgi:hypothetical protein
VLLALHRSLFLDRHEFDGLEGNMLGADFEFLD